MPRVNLVIWLDTFPQSSIQKLQSINKATNGAYHMILALSYGLCDDRIRRLNRMVVNLLVSRLKAKRHSRLDQVAKINKTLFDFHWAVDQITKTTRTYDSLSVCNSVPRHSLAGESIQIREFNFNV